MMSGKGSGKKRNRSAQSSQHGFHEYPEDTARRPGVGEAGGATLEEGEERQRIIDKLRELEERRREASG